MIDHRALDDDRLLDEGARLEREEASAREALRLARERRNAEARRLGKPGVKLLVDLGLLGGGILLVPATGGISLWLSLVGVAKLAWDTWDLGRDARPIIALHIEVRRVRRRLKDIADNLEAIRRELQRRCGET